MSSLDDVLKIDPKKPRLHLDMTHFGKIIGKVQWIGSKSFRHYSKQNVQENLRHKKVDCQWKSLQKIFVIVLILYPNLTFLAFRAYLLEPPPHDYITKGKTIQNLNIGKCDKNYCTHSRISIEQLSLVAEVDCLLSFRGVQFAYLFSRSKRGHGMYLD